MDRHLGQARGCVLVGAICLLVATGRVGAITFELNFVNEATNPNDPDGSGLMSIAQEAAVRWADIIEDDHTITLNVSYYRNDALGSGPCGNGVTTACASIVWANAAQDRTVEGNLRFFADRNWYIDPTPGDDSEFRLAQTLYRDLTPAQQAAGYSGPVIEPLLEVGFRGGDNFSDPDVAGRVDMLSTALHEIGHHLGVTNQFRAARDEYADDDYDLPRSLLAGAVMAVEAAPEREYHFVDYFPLMSDQGSPLGSRRLPTAADVLSAAAVSGWSRIDLPRQDFLSGTSWGTAGNWIGGQVPGPSDAAFLRGAFNDLSGSGDVVLDRDGDVASLFVGTSSNLRTSGFRLEVGGTTTIEFDGELPFPQVFVETGGELKTKDLDIHGGGLAMAGGLAGVQDSLVIAKKLAGGSVAGFGTVNVEGALVNNGLITAADGTLAFTSAGEGEAFDLDGSTGEGVVRADAGDLVFAGKIHPNFAGRMTVGAGHYVEMSSPWRLAPTGVLNMNGGIAEATDAQLRGAPVEVEGTLNVDKQAHLHVPLAFNPTAVVNLPDSDDRLTLGGNGATVTYNGGTFSGTGTIQQNGSGLVVRSQTIDMDGTFDWDGTGNDSRFLVNPGTTFDLAATRINTGNNIYSGQLSLIAGTIDVDVADDRWTMAGTLTMRGADGRGASILGDPFDITGVVDADLGAAHTFSAPTRFLAGSMTHVEAHTGLQFNAPVAWAGGVHSGAGSLGINGSGTVEGATIDVAEVQIGGAAMLTVSAGSVTATDFVKEPGGILEFSGGDFTVDGGTGTFNSSFSYSGSLRAIQPTFHVLSGADVAVTSAWRVGEEAGEFGTTTIHGSGNGNRSTLRGTGGGGDGAELVAGHLGNGTVNVTGGGLADFSGDLVIGNEAGSHGLVTISGVDGDYRSEVIVARAGADALLNVGRFGSGRLRVENGARLHVGGDGTVGSESGAVGMLLVGGRAGEIDASAEIGGDLAVGGTLSTPGGTGLVAVTDGGNLEAQAVRIWPSGRIEIHDGRIAAGGHVIVDGGTLNMSSGPAALQLGGGGSLIAQNNGTLAGTGTIALGGTRLFNEAVVSPGDPIGELVVEDGAYVQEAGGALQLEIAGADSYDRLAITGSAELDGLLDVQLMDGFQPGLGDMFDVLSATGGLSGRFATTEYELPALSQGLEWLIQYGPTDVILEIAAAALLGDYNDNGQVEQADLDLVLLNWGTDAASLPHDWINGRPSEGTVDQAELDGVLLNWGNAAAPGRPTPLPEPATIWLLVTGGALLLARSSSGQAA